MIFYKNRRTGIYHTPGPDPRWMMCGTAYSDATYKQIELERAPMGMECRMCEARAVASKRTGKNYAQIKESHSK